MDLIDEEHIPCAEIGQQSCQISGLFNGRAGGNPEIYVHLIGDDGGKGGFSQSGRAVKQDVIQGLSPCLSRLDIDGQVFLDLVLPDVFPQGFGPQGEFNVHILRAQIRRGQPPSPFKLAVFVKHPLFLSLSHLTGRRSYSFAAKAFSPYLIISSTEVSGSSLEIA